ncbi:MAG: anaerobic carbon-monoxide dehydrogenase catalytic subunit [Candidatus Heimdallarchaeota archaeon]
MYGRLRKEAIEEHESHDRLFVRLQQDGITNIWDRFEAQGLAFGEPDRRCQFCLQGVRCDLCSNGPCRADVAKDKRGVCGMTGDGMAMRMMLLRNVMGTSTYQYHTEQTIKTLRAIANGKSPFKITEPEKLKSFAKRLGIDTSGKINDIAKRFCDFVEEDFNRKFDEPSVIVELLAPEERKEVWKKLDIFPGGIHGEIMFSTSSCLTNVDGYYVSLALKAMRIGIAMAYQSQIVTEYIQDVIYGIPKPHKMRVDLGVLDPDYVNVLPNGHEPFLGFALVQLAREEAWQKKAKEQGAKGLRIIANIETGQEMIQRWEMDDVFYGYTGNWIMQEAILAVAFDGVTERINYVPEKAKEQAAQLLQMAVDNYKERRASIEPITGLPMRECIVGFSTESILEALGGTLDPLLDAVKNGSIKGIVGMVSCTTLRDWGQDVHTVNVVKELIKRDILVLSLGCGNAGVQVAGLCDLEAIKLAGKGLQAVCNALQIPPVLSYGTCTDTGRLADLLLAIANALGVAVTELPVAAAAPEYMEQKATIDAIFALAFGLYTYVNPIPTITGGTNLVKLLTEDLKDITGGLLSVEPDAVKAVDGIENHIMEKRKKLGI